MPPLGKRPGCKRDQVPGTTGTLGGDNGCTVGRPVRSWTPWLAVALVLGGSLATAGLHRANAGLDTRGVGTEYWLANILNGLAWAVPGALIARARPRLPFGWILCGLGLAHVVTATLLEVLVATQAPPAVPALAGRLAYWVASWLWVVVPASVPVLLLLFPTGTLPSRRWRPALALAGLAAGVLLFGVALKPGSLAVDHPESLLAGLTNPFGLRGLEGAVDAAYELGFPLQGLAALLALASLLIRYRNSAGEVRQQVRWLALGTAASVAATVGAAIVPLPVGLDAPLIILPVTTAITIALVRHRLFAIDRVIRRSVAYGALVLVLTGLYAGTVGAGTALIGADARSGASVIGAIAVAAAFAPLRDRLRVGVDRLFYGGRADPYEVIAGIGRRLGQVGDPAAVLPRIAAEVARALKIPFVAIDVAGGRTVTWGTESASVPAVSFDLTHHGEHVGRLVVSPRPGDDELEDEDLAVLADLAPQVAAAADAVRLTEALQASRERLVMTREEERRRLRRDLHDGLGPAITGVSLRADAAARLVQSDAASAAHELAQVGAELRDILGEVRRLVDGLRPADLDQLGLAGAIRAQALRLGLQASVEASELGSLPAAIEVAAYRIVAEALTNVHRHAGASTCSVRLRRDNDLEIEVVDDGRGLGPSRDGAVGLASMHERAAEVGGTCQVGPAPGRGTRVLARFPAGRGQ